MGALLYTKRLSPPASRAGIIRHDEGRHSGVLGIGTTLAYLNYCPCTNCAQSSNSCPARTETREYNDRIRGSRAVAGTPLPRLRLSCRSGFIALTATSDLVLGRVRPVPSLLAPRVTAR